MYNNQTKFETKALVSFLFFFQTAMTLKFDQGHQL